MRTMGLTGIIRLMTASFALFCVLDPAVAGSQTKPGPKATDMNVVMARIQGISVGMTPRRVLAEVEKHGWVYGSSSTDTLEDIIANNPSGTSVTFDLDESTTGGFRLVSGDSITAHFAWDNVTSRQLRVVMIVHTYDVPKIEYHAAVEAAKAHLDSLGGFTEKISEEPQFEHRLIYQKVDRSYVMYQFVELVKNASSFSGYYSVASY